MSPELASTIFAGLALVLSAYAAHRAHKASKLSNAIQDRMVGIEEERDRARERSERTATLRARLVEERDSAGTQFLVIENRGSGVARDVRVEIGGKLHTEHPAWVGDSPLPNLVGPQSEVRGLLMTGAMDVPGPPYRVAITWSDDTSEPGQYEHVVTI